jgi:hypothetical protein
MTNKLLSAAFALLLVTALGGCRAGGAGSPEAGSVRSMKGFELYSWQVEGEWTFALVVGTNRIKTVEEITSPEVGVEGLDALERELDRLAPGEQVFWSEERVPDMRLPPDDVIAQVRAYCEQRGLHLVVQAADVRWDPSPTTMVIRYYSPHTTAGLAGAYDRRYYIPEAQVWGDGRILWVSHEGARRRVLEGRLAVEQMRALLRRTLDAGFFGWEDEYHTLGGKPNPRMVLSVSLVGRSKEVTERGGAPDAYYELVELFTGGAGAAGNDYVPARGYLTAVPEPAGVHAPQWPDASAGISLDQVGDGRTIEGEALAFAWRMLNENPRAPVYVKSNGQVYSIMVQIPGVSFFEPPADTPMMTPTPYGSVTVTGLVYDALDGPAKHIAGATVSATIQDCSPPAASTTFRTTTELDGTYSLFLGDVYLLLCQDVLLEADADGFGPFEFVVPIDDLRAQSVRDIGL